MYAILGGSHDILRGTRSMAQRPPEPYTYPFLPPPPAPPVRGGRVHKLLGFIAVFAAAILLATLGLILVVNNTRPGSLTPTPPALPATGSPAPPERATPALPAT